MIIVHTTKPLESSKPEETIMNLDREYYNIPFLVLRESNLEEYINQFKDTDIYNPLYWVGPYFYEVSID